MLDFLTGLVICHVNIICHQKMNTSKYNQDNTVVCKFLMEVNDAPLPDWCYNKSTAQIPRKRNEF